MKTPSPDKLRFVAETMDTFYRYAIKEDTCIREYIRKDFPEVITWLNKVADIEDHTVAAQKVLSDTVKAIESETVPQRARRLAREHNRKNPGKSQMFTIYDKKRLE